MEEFASIVDFKLSPYGTDDEDEPISMTKKRMRRATADVRELLLTAVFDVDSKGNPVDPSVKAALRDATCAQAAWGVQTGDVSGAQAAAGPISLGPLSLGSRATATSAADVARGRYSPEAVRELRTAGLIPNGPLHG